MGVPDKTQIKVPSKENDHKLANHYVKSIAESEEIVVSSIERVAFY
jgi:hypothetical protein